MEARTASQTSRPGRGPEDLGIVDGLVQLSFLIQSVLARVAAGSDISMLQGRLLGVLRDREPTMAQLARLLELDKSSATGLIDRAEHRGLVRRLGDPRDGRTVRVALTARGGELARVLGAEVAREVAALTDDLSDTNRRRLSLLASQVVSREAAMKGVDLVAEPSRWAAEDVGRAVK
jgi:DNA-binding MarR family transcriptional regulator